MDLNDLYQEREHLIDLLWTGLADREHYQRLLQIVVEIEQLEETQAAERWSVVIGRITEGADQQRQHREHPDGDPRSDHA